MELEGGGGQSVGNEDAEGAEEGEEGVGKEKVAGDDLEDVLEGVGEVAAVEDLGELVRGEEDDLVDEEAEVMGCGSDGPGAEVEGRDRGEVWGLGS